MNTGDKPSQYLSPYQATMLDNGVHYAHYNNTPLNRIITINFNDAEIWPRTNHKNDPLRPPNYRVAYLHKYATYIDYHLKLPPYYIWVFENPDGILHLHIQLYCPQHLYPDLKHKAKLWLVQLGGIKKPGAIDIHTLKRAADQGQMTRYLTKAAPPAYCAKHNIDHDNQGIVCFKRAGVSETLTPNAIAKNPLPDAYRDLPHLVFALDAPLPRKRAYT